MKNLTSIVLILIAVGLFYTFTSPQYEEVKVLGLEANEYQNVLRNASAISNTMSSLFERYEQFPREEIDRLEKALPDNVDAVRLALDLDGMASNYGIAIKNIKVEVSATEEEGVIYPASIYGGDAYGEVNVSFSFVSNYQNFRRFLADMESSLRIIDVRSVSFQPTESGLYEHSVSVTTYWIK